MSVRSQAQDAGTVTFGRIRRADRRHAGRLAVSLPAHIHPFDPGHRNKEEVRRTLDFNRSGLYFITPLEHYYAGMRVLLIFPYSSVAPMKRQFLGKVVRVEQITSHWRGVAVQFIF